MSAAAEFSLSLSPHHLHPPPNLGELNTARELQSYLAHYPVKTGYLSQQQCFPSLPWPCYLLCLHSVYLWAFLAQINRHHMAENIAILWAAKGRKHSPGCFWATGAHKKTDSWDWFPPPPIPFLLNDCGHQPQACEFHESVNSLEEKNDYGP